MSIPLQLLCIYAFFVTARLVIISRSRRRIIREIAQWQKESAHWKGESEFWNENSDFWKGKTNDWADFAEKANASHGKTVSTLEQLVRTSIGQSEKFAKQNAAVLEKYANGSPHYNTSNGKLNPGPVLH